MKKFGTKKYNANSATEIGVFNSTVRFLRKTTGRKGKSTSDPSKSESISYDMTGNESPDHKLEIGAPILISKTTIDSDSVHNIDDALKQPGCDSDIFSNPPNSMENRSSYGEKNISYYSTKAKDAGADGKTPALTIDNVTHSMRNRSKSTSNLHKAELNLFFMPASSTENCMLHNYAIQPDSNQNMEMRKPISLELNAIEEYRRSRNSVALDSSLFDGDQDDDLHLRSVSVQSLDERNLFLSIEELNDITKQINDSDEFESSQEFDLEYCAHRNNLKPTERRITLLRNKSRPKLIGLKKDKLANAWDGFKLWFDEERGKIKEVVNKHAAAQRVGAYRSAEVATSAIYTKSLDDVVRSVSSYNRIDSNGDEYISGGEIYADTNDAMGQHTSRYISGGSLDSEDHKNNMAIPLSNASVFAKEENNEEHFSEVKFEFMLLVLCAK